MHGSQRLTLLAMTIWVVSTQSWSRADEKQPDVPRTGAEQKSELAKLREIFASVDKLPAKDARWVEVQVGSAKAKTWQMGWLLHESDAEIQLLTEQGTKETFDKKKLTAKKPPTEFEWRDVWAVRNADFTKDCRDFLTEKKKDVKDDPTEGGVYRLQRDRARADAAVVDAARLASWANAIQFEIRLLPRRDPAQGDDIHLRRHEEVVVEGQELLNRGSATVGLGQETPSEWDSEEWKRLVTTLQNAMITLPGKQFQVRVEVTRGR